MREIKFRGWHTVQKKMFSAEEMAADQLTMLPTGSFINVSSTHQRLSEIFPADKFIPLQFTGLHDKNGKEIFEGDIVSIWFEETFFQDTVKGSIEWNDSDAGYHIVFEDCSIGLGILDLDYAEPEVIGNIYENPELITHSN